MRAGNFCEQLPEGYREVYHLNAKAKKTGLILSVGSLVMALAVILPCLLTTDDILDESLAFNLIALLVCCALIIGYVVAHELVHGAAYKLLTGRKLTFGITLTVAFCGVPDIYVSRRTALIALLAPFTVFSLLFSALAAGLYFVNHTYYAAVTLVLGVHFGGCIGDLYMTCLLLFKYKNKRLLMRDTGPEQFIYYPPEEKLK